MASSNERGLSSHEIPKSCPQAPESKRKIPVSELRIAVHPLFKPDTGLLTGREENPKKPSVGQHYRAARASLFSALTERFVPESNTQVTVVMHLDESNHRPETEQFGPQLPTKHDVVPTLKSHSKFSENVIETPDILTSQNFGARHLIHGLEDKGFRVTPFTSVIVGGEWTGGCVSGVVTRLLRDPIIRMVFVDLKSVIGASHFLDGDSRGDKKKDIKNLLMDQERQCSIRCTDELLIFTRKGSWFIPPSSF